MESETRDVGDWWLRAVITYLRLKQTVTEATSDSTYFFQVESVTFSKISFEKILRTGFQINTPEVRNDLSKAVSLQLPDA